MRRSLRIQLNRREDEEEEEKNNKQIYIRKRNIHTQIIKYPKNDF